MAEKKLRNENVVMGSLGGGAVGYPNSSTSGRGLPSKNSARGSSGNGPCADGSPGTRPCRYRRMGGGTASSSLVQESSSAFPTGSGG